MRESKRQDDAVRARRCPGRGRAEEMRVRRRTPRPSCQGRPRRKGLTRQRRKHGEYQSPEEMFNIIENAKRKEGLKENEVWKGAKGEKRWAKEGRRRARRRRTKLKSALLGSDSGPSDEEKEGSLEVDGVVEPGDQGGEEGRGQGGEHGLEGERRFSKGWEGSVRGVDEALTTAGKNFRSEMKGLWGDLGQAEGVKEKAGISLQLVLNPEICY